MARTRRDRFRSSLRHRLGVAVALLAYLAAAVGFPLPASPLARKDLSAPFPCQDNPCGCQNAEQCWSGCCCLTPEERWAWAEAHNVQPPEYAEKPAAKTDTCDHDHDQHKSCCAKGEPAATCHSCCEHGHSDHTPDAAPATGKQAGVRWALGMSSLHCKGLTTLWVGSGAVLPLPRVAGCVQQPVPQGQFAQRDVSADRVVRTPPSPPPRTFPV
jgi:hypothetical protein